MQELVDGPFPPVSPVARVAMSLIYTILHHIRTCLNSIITLFYVNRAFSKTLTFDNGIRVRIGKQIAEGGFSFVFEAIAISDSAAVNTTSRSPHFGRLVLKRINCPDSELLQSCREEAGIHRSLPRHDNLLELLGFKVERDANDCNVSYMLFPRIQTTLRGEISERNILKQDNTRSSRSFTVKEVLSIFGGILDGLSVMHANNISHRDVKIENVLLKRGQSYRDGISSPGYTPILMDFGSAGPLSLQLNSRRDVLTAIETASQHTTLSYRPPELFEGGLRHNEGIGLLNYDKVDVWSLGCVLFGLMHGCSPFEMEFVRSNSYDSTNYSALRIVECSHLKILGDLPLPLWVKQGGMKPKEGYPLEMYDFVKYMVCQDRLRRPDTQHIFEKFDELYAKFTEMKWTGDSRGKERRGDDGFDSLIASRDFL